jgi:hypothetical protein
MGPRVYPWGSIQRKENIMATESAQQALSILRDASLFQWYLIPFLAVVFYVYSEEIDKRNWDVVLAGLGFWAVEWIYEIMNSLVFYGTQKAPLWGAPGKTAYLLLIGLNIEICFMFAIAGVVFTKMLPKDKKMRILGLSNRTFFAMCFAAFCVFVEILLNSADALTWDYSWWCAKAPWLIFAVAYFPLIRITYCIYDMDNINRKASIVGGLLIIDIIALALFAGILEWI